MAWGQVNRLGVGKNYVCCLVVAVIFMGIGVAKVRGLKSSNGGKLKGLSHKVKGGGGTFYGGVDTLFSELPTYFDLFCSKKSSMICTT